MTKLCGICFKSYNNLSQHLRISHTVKNKQERYLLLKYGSARFQGLLKCPICDKQNLVRLDKHLIESHSIKHLKDRIPIMKQAKRSRIMESLAVLRRSDPITPMVSSLDIGPESDHDPDPLNLDTVSENENSFQNLLDDSTDTWTHLMSSAPKKHPEPGEHSYSQTNPIPEPEEYPVQRGQELDTEPLLASSSFPDPKTSITIKEVFKAVMICVHKIQHIDSKLDRLERSLENIKNQQMSVNPQTHSALAFPQKGEKMEKNIQRAYLYEVVLNDFEKYRLGARTAERDINDAHLARSHGELFCKFMLGQLPSSAGRQDLTFLNQVDKLWEFPYFLEKKGYTPSTIIDILNNVQLFLEHIMTGFERSSQLTRAQLSKLCSEMYIVHKLKAEVLGQKNCPQETENNLNDKTKFMNTAREQIPALLQRLDKTPNVMGDHNKLMGYLLGYLAIVSRHRSVVLTNITKNNIAVAGKGKNKKRFHIVVGEDQTVEGRGEASIILTQEEFQWLDHLINIYCCNETSQCQFMFHTILGEKISKPVNFLQEAWTDCGLKSRVTFELLRSNVLTQTTECKQEVTQKSRIKKPLSHSQNTKDSTNDDILLLEDEASTTDYSTTEDEQEPPLDDEPDDDSVISLSSLEEYRKRKGFGHHCSSLYVFGKAESPELKSCFVQLTRLNKNIVDMCDRGQRVTLSNDGLPELFTQDLPTCQKSPAQHTHTPEPPDLPFIIDTLDIMAQDIIVSTTEPPTLELTTAAFLEPPDVEMDDHDLQILMETVDDSLQGNAIDKEEPRAQEEAQRPELIKNYEPSEDVQMETPEDPAQQVLMGTGEDCSPETSFE